MAALYRGRACPEVKHQKHQGVLTNHQKDFPKQIGKMIHTHAGFFDFHGKPPLLSISVIWTISLGSRKGTTVRDDHSPNGLASENILRTGSYTCLVIFLQHLFCLPCMLLINESRSGRRTAMYPEARIAVCNIWIQFKKRGW